MSDRQLLAAALDNLLVIGNAATYQAVLVMREAARERLAQLPKQCGTCDGTGWADKGELLAKVEAAHTGKRVAVAGAECSDCHGSGKVYPVETVERLAEALSQVTLGNINAGFKENRYPLIAAVILDALNAEIRAVV